MEKVILWILGIMFLIGTITQAKTEWTRQTNNGIEQLESKEGFQYLQATTGADALTVTMSKKRPDGGTDFFFVDVKPDGSVKYYELDEK
jgi:hypothetical protein